MTSDRLPQKFLNQYRVALLWIFLAALTLRMAWIYQYQASPFFDNPSLDFTFFDQHAREILQGRLFSDTYLFSPLYPLFLAPVYMLFGTDLFYPRLIQALLGALLVFPVYHIAAFAFNRRTALITAAACALYMPLMYYDGILMATTLHVFFLALSTAFLAGVLSRKRTACAGLLMGLVLLAAPNYLIVAAAAALWIITCSTDRFTKKTAAFTLLYLGCTLAAVAPITVYHAVRHGEFVFVAPHGGINFYLGNHEHATGTYMSIPGISDLPGRQTLDSQKMASEALGRPATHADVSAYWAHKTIEFLKNDPGAFLTLQLRKIALFWNAYEMPSEYGLDFDTQFHSILQLPLLRFGWIAPLALAGLVLAFFSTGKRNSLLPVFMLTGIMVAVIVFFVHARYRMPATPWVMIFAGFCISEIIRFVREKRWKTLVLTGAMIMAAAVFVHRDMVERNDLPGWFNRAQAHLAAGDTGAAEDCLHEILKRDNSMKTWFLLGSIQMGSGRLTEAETSFQNVLYQDPDHYEALVNLGALYAETDRNETAARLLERAVRLYPEQVQARLALAALYLDMNRMDDARLVLEHIRDRDLSAEWKARADHLDRRLQMTVDTVPANDQAAMD
jgi:4-amino-4-deoxy-L-arabinose transferase-like glycosyltransferase